MKVRFYLQLRQLFENLQLSYLQQNTSVLSCCVDMIIIELDLNPAEGALINMKCWLWCEQMEFMKHKADTSNKLYTMLVRCHWKWDGLSCKCNLQYRNPLFVCRHVGDWANISLLQNTFSLCDLIPSLNQIFLKLQ